VLSGYQKILDELRVEGDLHLPGVYELGRTTPLKNSPVRWSDSGELRAVNEVAGAQLIPERSLPDWPELRSAPALFSSSMPTLSVANFKVRFSCIRRWGFSARGKSCSPPTPTPRTNSLEQRTESCFTLAVATESLTDYALQEIGLGEGKPFYTVDLPYLWGRLLGKQVIFGSGLVHFSDCVKVFA